MKHPDDSRLTLYLAHRRGLVNYAARLVGSVAQAEDVVQEAWLRFVPAQDAARQPVSYLYRIVRNLALDGRRRLAAEGRRDLASQILKADTTPTPEDTLVNRDQLAHVQAALAELPDRTRTAFEMNRLGGLSFAEIGAQLDISTASAHRLTQEALLHIMRRLNRPAK